MATFNYSGLTSTVDTLLGQFGTSRITQIRQGTNEWEPFVDPRDTTLKYRNTTTGDVVDTKPSTSPTTKTTSGVVTGFTEDTKKDFNVAVGDKLLLLYDIMPPELGDVFEVNGIKHNYKFHTVVEPAETTLLYKVQVGR